MAKAYNSSTSNLSKLPKVIIVSNNKDLTKQDYNNVEEVIKFNIPTVELFNDIIKQYRYQSNTILGFLAPYHNFTDKDSLNKIIATFQEHNEIASVYTDTYLHDRTRYIIHFPTFIPSVVDKIIVNTPLFVKHNYTLPFNTDLNNLYLYEMWRKLGGRIFLHHIAEPLTTTKQISQQHSEADVALLNHVQGNT